MKTLKDIAETALEVQDACNLSGVVHSFSEDISTLRKLFPNEGTAFYNRHPVVVMYASKIASLTACEDLTTFADAYEQCRNLQNS